MNKSEDELSRSNRKKKRKRSDRFLNGSILIVVVLIIITATFVFRDGSGEEKAGGNPIEAEQEQKDSLSSDEKENQEADNESDKKEEAKAKAKAELKKDADKKGNKAVEAAEEPGTLTHLPSDDSVVVETIVNTAWEPVATKQTGEHVSEYDRNSVDWHEKKEAIAYATGNNTESLIFWKVNNGGSPKKSVGIVSTHDKSEKYRVYIEWIEQEGWKPVQVDILDSLDLK